MTTRPEREILDVLACDIGVRPKLAPTFGDLKPHVLGVRRDGGEIVVQFAREAADMVAALVEAERLCCPDIGWDLRREPGVSLHITAKPVQLDTLYALIAGAV